MLVRLVGQRLSERLSQPFIIENRPGAGGNIGTEAVVNAAPDGYTLLVINTANAINATLYDKLNFDFIRDIAPVAGTTRVPLILEVNPTIPVNNVSELISYAKSHPGKLSVASAGIGTSTHMAFELFKAQTATDMVHVPYRGNAAAVVDLLGGQVQVMFDVTPTSLEHIKAGTLRALGVTTASRWEGLPDLQTVGEVVPGYEASAWFGVGVPRNTPPEIIEKLNREINATLAEPTIKARLLELGSAPLSVSPADLQRLIADETEKWARVVRFSGAKVN
jgi:tripartite-type tricarboxylate transporter receptor subunit TctC